VAKAGAVKNDHAMVLGGHIDQSARLKILNHTAIAVKQDHGFT
jgi:hypothetical protein